jgi:hypothetical protein
MFSMPNCVKANRYHNDQIFDIAIISPMPWFIGRKPHRRECFDTIGGFRTMLLAPTGRRISITFTPATPLGMPVSINRNTQRIDDPKVNIS